MNNDHLKRLLHQYKAPAPPPRLEQRLLDKIARLGQADSIPEQAWTLGTWNWTFSAYVVVFSLVITLSLGFILGSYGQSGLLAETLSSSQSIGGIGL